MDPVPPTKSKRTTEQVAAFITLLAVFSTAQTVGQGISLPVTPQSSRTVIVSIPDRKLAVVEDGNVLATFPVAVGAAASPSPVGEFQIINRVANPAYCHAGSVIPSENDNPVGTRWLGLSLKGYGIHGTNAPRSVGHAASHGCIRLRNRDVERLFTMLRIGDVVEIHSERDEQVARIFGGIDNAATQISGQAGGQ